MQDVHGYMPQLYFIAFVKPMSLASIFLRHYFEQVLGISLAVHWLKSKSIYVNIFLRSVLLICKTALSAYFLMLSFEISIRS